MIYGSSGSYPAITPYSTSNGIVMQLVIVFLIRLICRMCYSLVTEIGIRDIRVSRKT